MKLYELIYTSQAVSPTPDIDGILGTCLLANACHNVTGCLIWDAGARTFTQLIEGEKPAILQLYKNIKADKRHHSVVTVHEGTISRRSFPQWSMRYVERQKIALGNDANPKDLVAYLALNQGKRVFDQVTKNTTTKEIGNTDDLK